MKLSVVYFGSKIVSQLLNENLSPALSYRVLKLAEDMNRDLEKMQKIKDEIWSKELEDSEKEKEFFNFLETQDTLNVYNKIPLNLIEKESFKISPNTFKILMPFLEE